MQKQLLGQAVMLATRFLYLIGFIALSASTSSAWAQVDTVEPDNKLETETEASTDCVENKTCQKVQSEDEKQKAQTDPIKVEDPVEYPVEDPAEAPVEVEKGEPTQQEE